VPNKVSAKKRVRQNERRRVHNRAIRSDMRTAIKKATTAIETSAADTPASLQAAQSKLAKAAKRNIIKKNNLARKISRLMKAANKAKQPAGAQA